jgi:hypothetical protein
MTREEGCQRLTAWVLRCLAGAEFELERRSAARELVRNKPSEAFGPCAWVEEAVADECEDVVDLRVCQQGRGGYERVEACKYGLDRTHRPGQIWR